MNKTAILGTALIVGVMGLALPAMVFWATKTLVGYNIAWELETVGAFWVLYFLARGQFSFGQHTTKKTRRK